MTDWTTDAADAIERSVAVLREQTVERASVVVRVIGYALLAAIVLIPASLLMFVGTFRVLNLWVFHGYVWLTWCAIGGFFVLSGALLWAKRVP